MLSTSLILRSLAVSLMLFLAFERAIVLADEDDYDPCKAGKFKYKFLLQFDVPSLLLFANEAIFPRLGNDANLFALVSAPIS